MTLGRQTMANKPARGHHYVSRFYLEGFASAELAGSRVWQWDLKRHIVVPASVEDIGKERDFNLHTNSGFAPDAIEKALAQFESPAAEALKSIRTTRTPLPVENLQRVLSLASLYAVRNPGWRRFLIQFTERIIAQQVRKATDTREKRERIAAQMTEAGTPTTADALEKADKAYREGRLIFSMPQNSILAREFERAVQLERLLNDRVWTLVQPIEDRDEFIASDSPVVLGSRWGALRVPVTLWSGWGRPETTISFPLSPRLALLGSFGGNTMTAQISSRAVADINTRTLRQADQFLFTASKSFVVLDHQGRIQQFPPTTPSFRFVGD